MGDLFDLQTFIFVGLTAAVILIALIVLAITNHRVRYLLDEVQALRREMKLIDDGLKTVTAHLERKGKS